MSNPADKQRHEQNLESFTASFLLSEFRKDIRSLHDEFRLDINAINTRFDTVNNKIDSNFKWTLSILFLTTFSIIGTMIGLTFATH